MTSKADIKSWFNALEQTIEDKRITDFRKLDGEVIKKAELNSGELYIFFESGKWLKVGNHTYYDETEISLDNAISVNFDLSEFLNGGLITQHIVNTANKYTQELREIEWDERDRNDYERLKRKFGNT